MLLQKSKSTINDIVVDRERFFSHVDLYKNQIFCCDDRASKIQNYVKIFGGLLNISFNTSILQFINEPADYNDTNFVQQTESTARLLHNLNIKAGVHSDYSHEHGESFDSHSLCHDIGCAYGERRQLISSLIAERDMQILNLATKLRPELFITNNDIYYAYKVIAAHKHFASSNHYFDFNSREVIEAAIQAGAPFMVVVNQHSSSSTAIVNLVENTSLQTTKSLEAGLPSYNHDSWAWLAIYNKISYLYPSTNTLQAEIAEFIDTLGTILTLGIKQELIAIRR